MKSINLCSGGVLLLGQFVSKPDRNCLLLLSRVMLATCLVSRGDVERGLAITCRGTRSVKPAPVCHVSFSAGENLALSCFGQMFHLSGSLQHGFSGQLPRLLLRLCVSSGCIAACTVQARLNFGTALIPSSSQLSMASPGWFSLCPATRVLHVSRCAAYLFPPCWVRLVFFRLCFAFLPSSRLGFNSYL